MKMEDKEVVGKVTIHILKEAFPVIKIERLGKSEITASDWGRVKRGLFRSFRQHRFDRLHEIDKEREKVGESDKQVRDKAEEEALSASTTDEDKEEKEKVATSVTGVKE